MRLNRTNTKLMISGLNLSCKYFEDSKNIIGWDDGKEEQTSMIYFDFGAIYCGVRKFNSHLSFVHIVRNTKPSANFIQRSSVTLLRQRLESYTIVTI